MPSRIRSVRRVRVWKGVTPMALHGRPALGAFDDDIERMIVVSPIKFFEFDEIFGLQMIDNGHDLLFEQLAISN